MRLAITSLIVDSTNEEEIGFLHTSTFHLYVLTMVYDFHNAMYRYHISGHNHPDIPMHYRYFHAR